MSDPFSTLIKGVAQSVTNTANQAAQTANDVAEGAAKSLNEFTSSMDKEMDDVGKAAKEGNFAKALVEGTELFSLGTQGAHALRATGFLPDDPVVTEIASGAINFLTGNTFGALKDLGDAFGAMSTSGTPAAVRPAESHRPQRPDVAHQRARAAAGSQGSQGPRAHGGYASINVNIQLGFGAQLSAATTLHARLNVCMAHSPICRPFGAAMTDAIRDAMGQNGIVQKGPSDPNQPLGERSIEDILNDPSLSFEDMVALVMFKICKEERAKVEAEIAKLNGGGDPSGAESTGATGSASPSQSGASASGGSGDAGPLGGLLGGGDAAGGGFDLGMIGKLALASTGGLPGLALAFASDPQLLSGTIGMAKGLAPILAPMISAGLMAVPPIGPLIAPFVPMLLPMVLDVAEQAAGGLGGAAGGKAGQGAQDAKGGGSGDVAGGAARGSAEGKKLAKGGTGKADKNESTSRQETMEMIKIMMQRLQEMQQALSNVLNSMHEGAMNSIRNIK